MRDAQHLGHACVQAGIGELALTVKAHEPTEFGFIQAAVILGGGLQVLEHFGAGILRGLEEIFDDTFTDAHGPFIREPVGGEYGMGGGLGSERCGRAHDCVADGEVHLHRVHSGGEFAFDEVFIADDGGGGGPVAHLAHLAAQLVGLVDLALDGCALLLGLARGGGLRELPLGEDFDALRPEAGDHREGLDGAALVGGAVGHHVGNGSGILMAASVLELAEELYAGGVVHGGGLPLWRGRLAHETGECGVDATCGIYARTGGGHGLGVADRIVFKRVELRFHLRHDAFGGLHRLGELAGLGSSARRNVYTATLAGLRQVLPAGDGLPEGGEHIAHSLAKFLHHAPRPCGKVHACLVNALAEILHHAEVDIARLAFALHVLRHDLGEWAGWRLITKHRRRALVAILDCRSAAGGFCVLGAWRSWRLHRFAGEVEGVLRRGEERRLLLAKCQHAHLGQCGRVVEEVDILLPAKLELSDFVLNRFWILYVHAHFAGGIRAF